VVQVAVGDEDGVVVERDVGSGTRGLRRSFGVFWIGGYAPGGPSIGSTRNVTPSRSTRSVAFRSRRTVAMPAGRRREGINPAAHTRDTVRSL